MASCSAELLHLLAQFPAKMMSELAHDKGKPRNSAPEVCGGEHLGGEIQPQSSAPATAVISKLDVLVQ